MKNPCIGLFLLLLLNLQLRAQTGSPIQIPEVEVSETAIRSQPIELLEGKDAPLQSADRLLQSDSRIYIKDHGPGMLSSPSFFGTAAHHSILEWEGHSLNQPGLGSNDLSTIPVFLFSGIELRSGGAAEGIGGSLGLRDPLPATQLEISLLNSVGSFGAHRHGLQLAGAASRLNWRTAVYQAAARNDFSYTDPISGESASRINAGFSQWHALQELGGTHAYTDWKLSAWFSDVDRRIPSVVSVPDRGERQHDRHLRLRASVDRRLKSGQGELKFGSFFSSGFIHYRDPSIGLDSDTRSSIVDQFIAFKSGFKAHEWQIRAAHRFEKLGAGNFAESLSPDRHWIQLMASHNWRSQHGRLHSELSWQSLTDEMAWPTASLNWQGEVPTERQFSIQYGAGMGSQLRFPTLNDLHWNPGGNPLLNPERAFSMEAEVALEWKILRLSSETWHKRVINWINWQPTDAGYWQPENVALVSISGWRPALEAGINLGGEKKLKLHSEISLNRVRNLAGGPSDAHYRKQMIYSPRLRGFHELQFGWKGLQSRLRVVHNGRVFTSSDNRSGLDAAITLDFGIDWSIQRGAHQWQLGIQLNNLLNRENFAVEGRPLPGFNANARVAYRFVKNNKRSGQLN